MLNLNEFADQLDNIFSDLVKAAKKGIKIDYKKILEVGFILGGVNQTKLAEQLGVSKQLVSKWVNGQGLPSYANYLKIYSYIEKSFYGFMHSDAGYHVMINMWDVPYDETNMFVEHYVQLFRDSYFRSTDINKVWSNNEQVEGKREYKIWIDNFTKEIKKQNAKEVPLDNQLINFYKNVVGKESAEDETKENSLMDHPYLVELQSQTFTELNQLMVDSTKNYLAGYERIVNSMEMSELADNAVAAKLLGEDLYHEVYWSSLCPEPVKNIARKIWNKNIKEHTEVTWSYDDWQQRKMRRYQILMTLMTLLNVEHKFNYDLDDESLVESIQKKQPVTHITSAQARMRSKEEIAKFTSKIFGTGPVIEEAVTPAKYKEIVNANKAMSQKGGE